MGTESYQYTGQLPDFLRGCLWSYDIEKLNIDTDFKRISTNIMVYGDLKSISWLLDNFPTERIKASLSNPLKGEWDPRSLRFWSLYFHLEPDKTKALKDLSVA